MTPMKRFLLLLSAMLGLCTSNQSQALDREGAVDAARRQLKNKCTSATPCTFSAKAEGNKWYVRVEFNPGGHAILIFDQTGKLVGRVE